jgi:transcriptional regulator with XRE-family HTH domain
MHVGGTGSTDKRSDTMLKFRTPNALDPLLEPTLNRRLWAAYLRAGYTRASFARAMDVGYNLVQAWDTGRSGIGLPHLMRAQEIVGYTLDELCYGKDGSAVLREREIRSLDADGLRRLLDDLQATGDQCAALGELRATPAGSQQRYTPVFVREFFATFSAWMQSKQLAGLDGAMRRQQAIAYGLAAAVNAAAKAEAIAAGRRTLAVEPTPKKRKARVRKKVARLPTAAPDELH